MIYWAGLFPGEDKEMLIAGANTMLGIALKLLNQKSVKRKQYLLGDERGGGLATKIVSVCVFLMLLLGGREPYWSGDAYGMESELFLC